MSLMVFIALDHPPFGNGESGPPHLQTMGESGSGSGHFTFSVTFTTSDVIFDTLASWAGVASA